jgi:glutathione S-transferase
MDKKDVGVERDTARARSNLKIYHIEMRRSFRVIWLCEELDIPYELVFVRGDLMRSMELIKAVSPLMPLAPTVDFRGQILVESGAILELLLAHYGDGRLVPSKASPDFAHYLQFMHFAEGTAMDRMWATRFAAMMAKIPVKSMPRIGMVDPEGVLIFMDDYLSRHSYFGGQEFTAADIMMHYVPRAADLVAEIDSYAYEHIAAWRRKVRSRPAFKRAIDAGLPGGHDGDGDGWGLPIAFSDPPAVYEPRRAGATGG